MIDWMIKMLTPMTITIDTQEQYDKLINSELQIIFFLFLKNEENKKMLKRFETLANAYASEDVVFVNAVGKVFEGKVKEDKEYFITSRQILNGKHIYIDYDDTKSLSDFVELHRYPLFDEFSPSYKDAYKKRYTLWLYYTKDLENLGELEEMFIEMARKYTNVFFTKYDDSLYGGFKYKHGLSEIPSVSMLHKNERSPYAFNKKITVEDKEAIEQFIEDVLSNKAKPFIQSRKEEEVEEDEVTGNGYYKYIDREQCTVIVASVSQYHRNQLVKKMRKHYPQLRIGFMNTNYDDLPPEIEYEENECSIMVYPPHTEEVKYVDNPYFTNEESLLDAINDYCNLKIEFYDEDDEEFDSTKKEL